MSLLEARCRKCYTSESQDKGEATSRPVSTVETILPGTPKPSQVRPNWATEQQPFGATLRKQDDEVRVFMQDHGSGAHGPGTSTPLGKIWMGIWTRSIAWDWKYTFEIYL
jgi:hypothetical protein